MRVFGSQGELQAIRTPWPSADEGPSLTQPWFQPGKHSHDTGEPEADPDPTWLTGCWNRLWFLQSRSNVSHPDCRRFRPPPY